MNLKEAVNCYRCLLCKGHLDELEDVKKVYSDCTATPPQATLYDLAKVCVVGGHQRRIPFKYKNLAISVVEANISSILSTPFKSFEDLYGKVNSLIGSLDNIGPLTVYDVSLRIGHLLTPPIYPKNNLYLNNGAWDGARKLMGGRSPKNVMLFKDFFADKAVSSIVGISDLQSLPNSLVEDFLCVMHNFLDVTPSGFISDRDTTSTYIQIKKHS